MEEIAESVVDSIFYGYPNCEAILRKAKLDSVDGVLLGSAIRDTKLRWQIAEENIERACFINFTDGMHIDCVNAIFVGIFGVELGLVAMTSEDYNYSKAKLIKTIAGKMVGCFAAGCQNGVDDLLRRLYMMSWAGMLTRQKVFAALRDIHNAIGCDLQGRFQQAVDLKFHRVHDIDYSVCRAMISDRSFPTTSAAKSTPTRHNGPCMESTNAF